MARRKPELRISSQPGDVENARRDQNLIRGIQAGDTRSLEATMDQYDQLVRFTVFRSLRSHCQRDPQLLDALASEVWSGFVDTIRRTIRPPQDNLKSYLLRIVHNKCADYLRRAAREVPQTVEQSPGEPGYEHDPLNELTVFEDIQALRGCVEQLPENDRKLVNNIDLVSSGKWLRLAQELRMPESTLRSRWPKVLEALRRCVEKKVGKNREGVAPTGPAGDC